MSTNKKLPYEYIQRHYRDPGGDDPIKRWLPHPEVARAICGALLANGISQQDVEDGMQDIFVRVLTAFRKGKARLPADLREMKAFCAAVARKHAMATLRMAARRQRYGCAGTCEKDADEYTSLEDDAPVQLDPVDAGRPVEVVAQLFREGRMPTHGVAILAGVAAGCTYKEIAATLGITERAVEGRIGTMHEAFRNRMARLGLPTGMDSFRIVVSRPGAIDTLRRAG